MLLLSQVTALASTTANLLANLLAKPTPPRSSSTSREGGADHHHSVQVMVAQVLDHLIFSHGSSTWRLSACWQALM